MKNLIVALALLAGPILAQDAPAPFDPASIMPAETIVFVQADGGALVEHIPQLDLARVVYGEAFKSFLAPLRKNIPPTVDGITDPIAQWLPGQAAIGVSGIAIRMMSFDGSWERVRVTPSKPIDSALIHKIFRSNLLWKRGMPTVLWDLEAVAVVEPGPALREALTTFLENPPVPFEQKIVQRGARQILTLKFEPFGEDGNFMAPEIHADLTGDRWIIATTAELLAQATAKERGKTFAQDAQFLAARKRHTSGARALFAYGDARRFMEVAKPLLPPVAVEMAEDEGINSIQSFSLGWSLTEGGIRESMGVGLDERPKGFWRMLDAIPPGLQSIHRAPKRAVGVVAAKFDPALFLTRLDEFVGGLFPGMSQVIRDEWAQELMSVGINMDTDLVPALGDEIALIAMPPGGFGLPIPDLIFSMKVRDEAAFGRLMGSFEKLASQPPVILKEKEPGTGKLAWNMQWPVPPGRFDLKVHEKHLLGSTNPLWMRQLIGKWDAPDDSLVKDGEVFQKVMRGMTGGETESLVALAYGDLRVYLPLLTAFAAGSGALPDEVFKTKPMPDLQKMGKEFSGMAFGLRRDKHGVAFESFGPVGGIFGLMPMMLWSVGGAPMAVAEAVPVPVR